MKLHIGNAEPDGRMLIDGESGHTLFSVDPSAIDAFVDAIKERCGSEGDGYSFEFDTVTGKVALL